MDFKIKIKNNKHCRLVQEELFKQGIFWPGGSISTVKYTVGLSDVGMIYYSSNRNIGYTESSSILFFNNHPALEVTLEDIRDNGKKTITIAIHSMKNSRDVQELLFNNGIYWEGGKKVKHEGDGYLMVLAGKLMRLKPGYSTNNSQTLTSLRKTMKL